MTAFNTPNLTDAQIGRLLRAIDPAAVEVKRGMSYIAQYEVRAELTRVFGFGGWDEQVESMDLLYETKLVKGDAQYPKTGTAPEYWVTCYRASVRLNIRDYYGEPVASFVEYHAEENAPLPNRGEAHAMAVTSVESYALRRCAINLGDRFGLSLYDKGTVNPVVNGTLQLHERQQRAQNAGGNAEIAASQPDGGGSVPLGTPDAEALSQARAAVQAGFQQL